MSKIKEIVTRLEECLDALGQCDETTQVLKSLPHLKAAIRCLKETEVVLSLKHIDLVTFLAAPSRYMEFVKKGKACIVSDCGKFVWKFVDEIDKRTQCRVCAMSSFSGYRSVVTSWFSEDNPMAITHFRKTIGYLVPVKTSN